LCIEKSRYEYLQVSHESIGKLSRELGGSNSTIGLFNTKCSYFLKKNLCGIGNYILAEGLYRAGLDPFASLKEFTEKQQRSLFRALQSVALESYAAQGMTRQQGGVYATVDGSKGEFEMQLQCYGRQICPRGNPVLKDTAGPHGRTIWYTKDQLFMPLSQRYQSTIDGESIAHKSVHSGNDLQSRESTSSGWDIYTASSVDGTGENTRKLLSSLSDSGWKNILAKYAEESDSFRKLADFLQEEQASGQEVYPPHCDVFSALNLCPLDDVKVVIVGQDPYHGPGQGHGLAFSVRRGVPPPPSLKNIFQEAMEDVVIDPPRHGNLEHWARQGVLLLNSVLTVRRGQANSHAGKGWEELTDFIIQHLNKHSYPLVFLLFGNPAYKKAKQVDDSKHILIRTSHPSPLGASKTVSPFLGSRCFSRCNQALEDRGLDPIDWNVR
jgi:uracil-DNA glycosylase